MIRRICVIVLTLFGSRLDVVDVQAEEFIAVQSSKAMDVATVFARWQDAAADIERVDVEFTQYRYDLAFETVVVSDGRLVCETDGGQFLSLKPATNIALVQPMKVQGKPFTVRPGLSERCIYHESRMTHIDDQDRKCLIFRVEDPEHANMFSVQRSWFILFSKSVVDSRIEWFKTIGEIGRQCSARIDRSIVPEESFDRRFKVSLTHVDENQVIVSLESRLTRDAAIFRKIDIILSRETWLPDAMQLHDPAGTGRVVFVFRNRRVNFCREAIQSLFEPDLTGYKVQGDKITQ